MDYIKIYYTLKVATLAMIGILIGIGVLAVILSMLLYISYSTVNSLVEYEPFFILVNLLESIFS